MYAKRVCEDVSSILTGKDRMEVLKEFANDFAWNKIGDDISFFFQTLLEKGFSYNFIHENEEAIINELIEELKHCISYVIEVDLEDFEKYKDDDLEENLSESIEDMLKPKTKEEINNALKGWDKMILKDGRAVWLIEQEFPGMVGESLTWFFLVDENGEEYPLENETLDKLPFEMDDRIALVKLMDDTRDSNHNAAVSHVI